VEPARQGPGASAQELAEDCRRIIYATSREAVEKARLAFLRKWKLRCNAVSASFEEAVDDLFTFTSLPSSQWEALRTTNALERVNGSFADGPKPKPRCRGKRRFSSCAWDSCVAAKSRCVVASAGTI
jgi:hypothetical protein